MISRDHNMFFVFLLGNINVLLYSRVIYLSIFHIEVSLAQKQLEYVFKPSKYLWQFGYNGLVLKTSKQKYEKRALFYVFMTQTVWYDFPWFMLLS